MNRRLLVYAILIFCGVSTMYPQSNVSLGTSEQDTIAYMATLYRRRNEFIGQPLSVFIAEYKKYLPINFMGYSGTSPWIDPKGNSYVNNISICYHDWYIMQDRYESRRGNYIFHIEFSNPHVLYIDFSKQFPEGMSYSDKVDAISNEYLVKKISFYKSQIY
jgi:hypothetical protein